MDRAKARKAHVKLARRGARVIGLAAVLKTGAGAHMDRREKRLSNAKNDWRQEW